MCDILGPAFICIEIKAGTILFNAGDPAEALYIIQEGELGLKLSNNSQIVETMLPGTLVGGLELFANRSRACSLVALSDGVVWKLERKTYLELAALHSFLMLNFITKVAIPFDSVRYYNTVHHWAQLR